MMVMAGFFAACFLWGFRHFVQEALYETSDAGAKASLHGSTAESAYH